MDAGQAILSHGHSDGDCLVVWLVPDFQVEALVEVAQQFLWHGGEICAADDG
jgi:hypothetical protein